ncbi:lymphocyte antigen 86 [Neoarius graeffei]|uniref:lymphocyte antigen 86 n=1 Tax=Neoarius graeffei TaxID=443677 RepID=UPI00298BFE17|nr:lymphocyte antigen 86 [Neoarius graeffei]XP_060776704.1 lymphocyte antigen 86 [Neoarius graeffei]
MNRFTSTVKSVYFIMKLYIIVVILSMLHLPSVDTQEDYWPVHTACKSEKIQVIYRSCDPIQDVGFTLSSCSDLQTQLYVKISILLRQSIDELYLTVDLVRKGVIITRHDEPICLPNFPRFTFCGNRRGEMVTIQTLLKETKLPLKGHYNINVHVINQNGFQIACVNATAIFQ